jgi:hypothetical protein
LRHYRGNTKPTYFTGGKNLLILFKKDKIEIKKRNKKREVDQKLRCKN